jgi:hypothetical protein
VEAKVKGSDIKWNDFAGTLKANVCRVDNGEPTLPIFNAQLVHFTGNCGIKALSHLRFVFPNTSDTFKKQCISLIESFAYHRTNCGMLVGSDTNTVGHKGATLDLVSRFGEGYVVVPPTWNPNYTWAKHHCISLFWKDLNTCTHEDGWVQEQRAI